MKKTEFGGHVLVDTHAQPAAEQTAQRASSGSVKPATILTPQRGLHENFDGQRPGDTHAQAAVDGAGQFPIDTHGSYARPEPNGGHHFFETQGGNAANGDGRAKRPLIPNEDVPAVADPIESETGDGQVTLGTQLLDAITNGDGRATAELQPNQGLPAVADPIENGDGQNGSDSRDEPAITNGGGLARRGAHFTSAPADPTIRAATKEMTPTRVLPLPAGAKVLLITMPSVPPPTPQAAAIRYVEPISGLPLRAMRPASDCMSTILLVPASSPPTQTKGVKL